MKTKKVAEGDMGGETCLSRRVDSSRVHLGEEPTHEF